MKKVLIATILVLAPVLVLATQWSSPTLCPGVNTTPENYSTSLKVNGGIYQTITYELYYNSYNGNYQWNSGQLCSTPSGLRCITIHPSQHTGIVVDDENNVRWASSTDGLNWTWGDIITAWDRSGHYPMSLSCAWWDSQKWLYVAYDDGVVWGDAYPYDNPQPIDVGGTCKYLTVCFTGDYLVVQGWNGSDRDLYELTGYGNSWGERTAIDEINTGYDERAPVLGKIDAEEEAVLLWSAPGSVGSYDIWYSAGSSTASIQPTSLGNIKAIFK